MPDQILVTGGTGLLGRLVVKRLLDAGAKVRVMSRRPRPAGDRAPYAWATADLRSGSGVREATVGVGSIVHCATAFGRRSETQLARTLIDAARRNGTPLHLLYISIVGVDRVPLPYYQGKLAAERLVQQSGLPHTIMRATQFHDLLRTLFAAAATAPAMPVPDFAFQPIAVGEVADRLAQLAVGEALGRAPDIAGPEVRHARDLARAYLQATGRRRLVLPVRLPGKTFRAYRAGAHLAPDRAIGKITFAEYLAGYPEVRGRSYRGRR
ncbi:SDR family oxidoreductase [Micromonospora sp. H33]|uniref:SDR family oxidoreductase n=1 Tax=Micromonospora sp. H33 TaxID=3452215 RepID=UPI003F8BBE14